MTNYIDFYISAKEFLIKTKRVFEHDFDYVDESDITKVENIIGKKFPPSLLEFQRIFGKVAKPIPAGVPINLESIEDAYYKANDRISILESKNFKVYTDGKKIAKGKVYQVDDTDESENYKMYNVLELLDVDDFLFLRIDENATFISAKEEDPIVHYFIDYATFTSSMLPLSTHLRATLFNEITPKLGWNPNYYKDRNGRLKKDLSSFSRERFWLENSIDISSLEWAFIYDNIFREGQRYDSQFPIHFFKEIRRDFYQINSISEKQNGYVLPIDEFEWKFIDYLKKEGFKL